MIFEITIPEKVSLNKARGMRWQQWNRLADLYHMELLPLKGKLKVKKEDYPITIHYDWYFTKKPLDTLNTTLMCKLIEDGMVQANILEDDSTKYVRRSILDSHKSVKYKKDTVIVSVTKFVP